MNLLRAATLVVADLEATAARYAEWFGYETVERGVLAIDLAAAWDAPASAGRRTALCRPASGAPVFLRFVEGEPVEGYAPLRTHGWAAIELCVQDVLAVAARLERSPFEIIGPPRRNPGLEAIFPMQVRGPDGEIAYLTQIDGDLPEHVLPRAAAPVDRLFIVVLACSDMAASGAWLERVAGVTQQPPVEIPYTMLNRAFGLPEGTRHALATLSHGRDLFLEIDQLPSAATPRPRRAGELPPGVALCTLSHPDLDACPGPWLAPPTARKGAVYAGRRAGVVRGPDGALLELVEA